VRNAETRIRIQPATGRREMNEFIQWPMRLYRNAPFFVPPLIQERKAFFSADNPIFKFTEVAYFLAKDEQGATVGRMTAHINRRHNEFAGERAGFFGFFECVEDLEAARALLHAGEAWLRERGMSVIRGPFNFSTNDECGFLARGFDSMPVFQMPYTKRYYLDFMAALEYRPVKDLLAYLYESTGEIPPRVVRFAERAGERSGVTVRTFDRSRSAEEVKCMFDIYNRAWEKNWGFIPMEEAEFRYAAKNMGQVLDPTLALLAEKDGRPIGFSLTVPDYNPLFKKMNGRLLPFGFLHFLLGRRSIRRIRIVAFGVLREYHNRGVEPLLMYHTFKNALLRGHTSCDMSWILEENVLARRVLDNLGAVHYKTYRIFEKSL